MRRDEFKTLKKVRRKKIETLKRFLIEHHLSNDSIPLSKEELHFTISMLYSEYTPSNKILWFIGEYIQDHGSLPDPIEFPVN